MDLSDFKKLKVNELKQRLIERGLNTTGKKEDLLQRLTDYVDQQSSNKKSANSKEISSNDQSHTESTPNEKKTSNESNRLTKENVEAATLKAPPLSTSKAFTFQSLTPEITKIMNKTTTSTAASTASGLTPHEVKSLATEKPSGNDGEKLKARSERFGLPVSDKEKSLLRKQRFGMNDAQSNGEKKTPNGLDLEKLQSRADRFGTVVSPVITKVEEESKRKKRAERFALANQAPAEAKKQKTEILVS